ncbi:hypothetical protein BIW11_05097, partial [Tropilaelaps mercedesae]
MIEVKSCAIAFIVTAATVTTVRSGGSLSDENLRSSLPLNSSAILSQRNTAFSLSATGKSEVGTTAGVSSTAAGTSPVQAKSTSALVEGNIKDKVRTGNAREGEPLGGNAITRPVDRTPKNLLATMKSISVAQDTPRTQHVVEDKRKITDSEKLPNKELTAESNVNVQERNMDIQRHQDFIRPTGRYEDTLPGKMRTERILSIGLSPSIYDEDSHMFILFTVGMLLC